MLHQRSFEVVGHSVSKDGKHRRTEIGLHQDNGAPETSGCIGVVGSDWSRLCDIYTAIADYKTDSAPIVVGHPKLDAPA